MKKISVVSQKINYIPYSEIYKNELQSMIFSLYMEDPEGELISENKIEATIDYLAKHKESGEILLFTVGENIAGYSILINHWSNEYGGLIIFIDELYVKKQFRGNNIAGNFIKYLFDTKTQTKAFVTEVTQSNKRALNFYSKFGFHKAKNNYLVYKSIKLNE